jgi:hypothetical protein
VGEEEEVGCVAGVWAWGKGVGSRGRAEREALWRGRGGEEGCLGDGGKRWGLDGVERSVNSGYGSS